MHNLILPHGGGELRPLLLDGEARQAELARAAGLKKVPMTTRETSDLIMMGIGAFTPLDGFMGKRRLAAAAAKPTAAEQEGTVLAHPHHPLGRRGLCQVDGGRRRSGALGRRNRVHHGHDEGGGKIRHRQRVRVQADLPHHRPQASRRAEGHGAGRRSTWPVR